MKKQRILTAVLAGLLAVLMLLPMALSAIDLLL